MNQIDRLVMLPCPFCGRDVKVQTKSGELGYKPSELYIKCCHAYISEKLDDIIPIFNIEDRDRLNRHNEKVTKIATEKLIAAWNVRAT